MCECKQLHFICQVFEFPKATEVYRHLDSGQFGTKTFWHQCQTALNTSAPSILHPVWSAILCDLCSMVFMWRIISNAIQSYVYCYVVKLLHSWCMFVFFFSFAGCTFTTSTKEAIENCADLLKRHCVNCWCVFLFIGFSYYKFIWCTINIRLHYATCSATCSLPTCMPRQTYALCCTQHQCGMACWPASLPAACMASRPTYCLLHVTLDPRLWCDQAEDWKTGETWQSNFNNTIHSIQCRH